MLWSIREKGSGRRLRVVRARDAADALDGFKQDGGAAGPVAVTDAGAELATHDRALYGPVFAGFAWYDRARNAALLAAAGTPGPYEPHRDACSPFFRTAAEAARAALDAP